jgi:amino acid transporter
MSHAHDAEKNIDYGRSYEGEDEKVHPHLDHSNAYVGNGEEEVEETHRSLKPRQISMIAIGGAIGMSPLPVKSRMGLIEIGTGLVIGSGTSLQRSGPASLFLAYTIMGAV